MARVYSFAVALLFFALPSNGRAVDLSVKINSQLSYKKINGFSDDRVQFGLRIPIDLALRPGRKTSGAMSYTPQFETDEVATKLNHLLKASGGYSLSRRASFGANIEFLEVGFLTADVAESPDGTLELDEQGFRRSQSSLQGAYTLGRRWSVNGSVSHGLASYSDDSRQDSQAVAGSVELGYRRSPRNGFGLAFEPSIAFYPRETGRLTVKSVGASARWNHRFGNDLSFRVSLGPTLTKETSTSPLDDPVPAGVKLNYFGGAKLQYARARWSCGLAYNRKQSIQSGFGTVTVVDAVSLEASWYSRERWSYKLRGRASRRTGRNTNRRQVSIQLSAGRQITRRLRLNSAVLYSYQKNTNDAPRKQFRLEVGVSYSFRPVRL